MAEALPHANEVRRRVAADLIEATLTQVGSSFSAMPRTDGEILAFAEAMADMFDAYLAREGQVGRSPGTLSGSAG